MPEFALLGSLLYRKIFELADLVLELDDEADLSGRAEVADDEEADHFEEGFSGHALVVGAHLAHFFLAKGGNLHDVADVQVLDPFGLVQEA